MRFFPFRRELTLRSLLRAASIRRSGAGRATLDVDVLVWLGGDPERTAGAAELTLERLCQELPDACVTLLADGPEWHGLLRAWGPRFPECREIRLPRATDLPQLLFGMAVEGAARPWVAFLWPGCGVEGAGLRRLRRAAVEGAGLVYGDLASPPAELFHPVQPGWLQMADLVPMHNCLLRREMFGVAGGFDPSPLRQRTFWWDFTLRLSRRAPLVHVPVAPAPAAWEWSAFPFRPREAGEPGPPGRRPLAVTLLSGLLDAHQNQIFFYNFFEKVAGRGLLTWRTVLYDRCRPEDLAGCDLAIFSRPRFPEVPGLLDACEAAGVPVLVMIDDNWIAAGRELPRFERLFTPGKPPFEVFLDALRRADAVLVFNPVLEEDVRPHARRVLRLPANVDLAAFASAGPQVRAPGFLAGFAGSPRWEPSGFRGLARFLGRRTDARLLVMAHEVPEELRGVAPERVTFVPWRHDYAAYARALAGLRPDVLLAPLDASRFSASKIPVKFLDASAAGAAGIYSRVPPYTDHVRDGETGLLVENDEAAWEEALERLYADPGLRERIATQATREVAERYATERVLPAFLEVLQAVGRGR